MNAESNLLVSILINNYNYGRFLAAAVESALNQTYSNIEIVVVDDGSTDNSLALLDKYRGKLRVVTKPNGGQASAFNTGFSATSGEILCFLDADDLFQPEKVAQLVKAYAESPTAGWVFDQLTMMEDKGSGNPIILPSEPGKTELDWGLWDVGKDVKLGIMPYVPTATSGLSLRRALLASILPMPEAIRITSDNYIKFCSLAFSPGVMLQDSLTLQRIHGSNAYTHQKAGKTTLTRSIATLTAMALYRKSSDLRCFALNMLVPHLRHFRRTGYPTPALREEVRAFYKELPLFRRIRLAGRAAYHGPSHASQSA